MLVRPDVRGVTALRYNARVRPNGAVCVKLVLAVRLVVVLALFAFEASVTLSTDTNALSFLDQGNLGSNTNGLANNLCLSEPTSAC